MNPITESATPTEIPAITPVVRELSDFVVPGKAAPDVIEVVWEDVRYCEVDWAVGVDDIVVAI